MSKTRWKRIPTEAMLHRMEFQAQLKEQGELDRQDYRQKYNIDWSKRNKERTENAIISCLDMHRWTMASTIHQATTRFGLKTSERTIRNHLNRLASEEKVEKKPVSFGFLWKKKEIKMGD